MCILNVHITIIWLLLKFLILHVVQRPKKFTSYLEYSNFMTVRYSQFRLDKKYFLPRFSSRSWFSHNKCFGESGLNWPQHLKDGMKVSGSLQCTSLTPRHRPSLRTVAEPVTSRQWPSPPVTLAHTLHASGRSWVPDWAMCKQSKLGQTYSHSIYLHAFQSIAHITTYFQHLDAVCKFWEQVDADVARAAVFVTL